MSDEYRIENCLADLRPIRRSPLRDAAYEQIKGMIISNRLKPGTLLTIDDLVGRLDVSRTPVREALLRLQAEHLVEILPQRAIRITEITPTEVEELFAVRELLECKAVEHVSQTIPLDLLDRLDEELIVAERQVHDGKYDLFVRADQDLHGLICLHSGNTVLSEILAMIHDRAKRIRVFAGINPDADLVRVATAEHRAIVQALRQRDGEQAKHLIAEHLRNAIERIKLQVTTQQAAERGSVAPENAGWPG